MCLWGHPKVITVFLLSVLTLIVHQASMVDPKKVSIPDTVYSIR